MKQFDAVIIGSGQGGNPLAKLFAKAGYKTALIEHEFIGGTCINYGCTPTKTMIASARTAYLVANAAKFGVNVDAFSIDISTVLKRKAEVVEMFRNGSQRGLEETENLTLIFGKASFISSKEIAVKGNDGKTETIAARKVFINTGVEAAKPTIEGMEDVPCFTSRSMLELEEIPQHLAIIGAGYIGLEFGQLYRRLGSKVTIIEKAERVLPKEDEDVVTEIERFLKEEDISIRCSTKVIRLKNGKEIEVTVQAGDKEETITCTHLLIGAGTTPRTKDLNLEAAGVAVNAKGYIAVNDKLETSVPGIYAFGDVKGGPQFTHIAYNDHVILADNLLRNKNVSIAGRMVPYCMFTDPQLGRVGITEKEAREKGLDIKVSVIPMKNVGRAIETDNTNGLMKAVVDATNNKILGVAILGEQGGEVMTILQMAMAGNITYKDLQYMIFAHPIYAESINNLFTKMDK